MGMANPPQSGGIVKWQCPEPLGLTVTRSSEGPGGPRQALSKPFNGCPGISVDMAIRLSRTFGSAPET